MKIPVFQFNWKVTLFSVTFFVLFINLGFWQLDRAAEKEQMMALDEVRRGQMPVAMSDLPDDIRELSGLPVKLEGHYLEERFFLLDNRVLNGKVGFEVLVPFRELTGQLLLVNRGFIPMSRTRQDTQIVPGLKDKSTGLGSLYIAAENSFTPEDIVTSNISWPMIVQASSPSVLQKFLGEAMYPYLVRLNEADGNALPRYWPTSVISPVKHNGYALQWFTMALAIGIAFIYFSTRREDD